MWGILSKTEVESMQKVKGINWGKFHIAHHSEVCWQNDPCFMFVLMCNVEKWTVAVCADYSEDLVIVHACFVCHS